MSQKFLDYSSFLHGIRPTPMSDIPYQVLSMEQPFGGGSGAQFEVLFLGLGFNYNGQNDWAAGKGMLLFSI